MYNFKQKRSKDTMKTFTYIEIKNNFSKIFDMVKSGEEIVVSTEKDKEIVAIIIPYKKYRKRKARPLGILKGKASYKIKDDFKITDAELLSL
jgi:antitoxin (DNA-binding transcriptional repressor) of toxin-antitoxin stability system